MVWKKWTLKSAPFSVYGFHMDKRNNKQIVDLKEDKCHYNKYE